MTMLVWEDTKKIAHITILSFRSVPFVCIVEWGVWMDGSIQTHSIKDWCITTCRTHRQTNTSKYFYVRVKENLQTEEWGIVFSYVRCTYSSTKRIFSLARNLIHIKDQSDIVPIFLVMIWQVSKYSSYSFFCSPDTINIILIDLDGFYGPNFFTSFNWIDDSCGV